MTRIDTRASVQYQLDNLTDAEAAEWCEIAEVAVMTAAELREWWDDFTITGLEQLIFLGIDWEGENAEAEPTYDYQSGIIAMADGGEEL